MFLSTVAALFCRLGSVLFLCVAGLLGIAGFVAFLAALLVALVVFGVIALAVYLALVLDALAAAARSDGAARTADA